MMLIVLSVFAMSVYFICHDNQKLALQYRVLMSSQGNIQFIDNRGQISEQMQLSAKSRASALGCWLICQESSTQGQGKQRSQFIFKDGVSARDFSRLVRVIRSL